jgi:hemerythrin
MVMQWNNSLATGSDEIDLQHKELFKRVDGLLAAVVRGTDREETSKIVQYLTDYVVFHFGNEEDYMARYAYSSASAHKAQHDQFVKNFLKLKERLATEGINAQLADDTRQLVVDWLISHIKYSDRALGMFLKLKM